MDVEDLSPDETSALLEPVSETASTGGSGAHEKSRRWLERPSCGWCAVSVMMAGTLAVNIDGGLVQAGFAHIAGLFGRQGDAVFLIGLYPLVFILSQPVYTAAARRYSWTGPLLTAYLLFAAGLIACASAILKRRQAGKLDGGMLVLVVGRAVLASGAAAMGFIPSIVLNEAVETGDRAPWEFVQTVCASLGSLTGHQLSKPSTRSLDTLHVAFSWQLVGPVACATALIVLVLRARIFRQRDILPNLRGDNQHARYTASILALGLGAVFTAFGLLHFNSGNGKKIAPFPYWIMALVVGAALLGSICVHESHVKRRGASVSGASQRADALIPWSMDSAALHGLGLVLMIQALKYTITATISFCQPTYSTLTGITNSWLFSSTLVGDFLGSTIAAVYLSKLSSTKEDLPRLRVTVGIGAALLLVAVGVTAAVWMARISHSCINYAFNVVLGLGGSLIGFGLVQMYLTLLETNKGQYQATVYVALQMTGTLAYTATSLVTSSALRNGASRAMARHALSDEVIQSCLADLDGCLELAKGTDTDTAIRTAFLETLERIVVAMFVLTGTLGAILFTRLRRMGDNEGTSSHHIAH